MVIDDGALLAYCGIGFGTLFTSYAIMLDTELAQKKFSGAYLRTAFYNSMRMSQVSSVAMMGCCFIVLACSVCSLKHQFFSKMATWIACWATLFAICVFAQNFWEAMGYLMSEDQTARDMYERYTLLNNPPTASQAHHDQNL